MISKPIVIYGAGGFGREVLQVIRDINYEKVDTWKPLGFIVDEEYIVSEDVQGLPILGSLDWLKSHNDVYVIIAVGSSSARYRIAIKISNICRNDFATLVHPRAWIGEAVSIGCGTIICAGALITTDIKIGQHVHINIGSTIGHDATLIDFVTLNPSVNISGNVFLEKGVEVGTGSVIIPRIRIGEWSIIGAGSTVTKPLGANVTAVGSPARVIKERTSSGP